MSKWDERFAVEGEKIRQELPGFEPLCLRAVERDICEGLGHTGAASMVPFVGHRKEPGDL